MAKDLIVIDNSLVTSAYNLTLNEQRLIYCVMKQIPKGEPIEAKTPFYITREDFIELGSDPSNVAQEIRQATRDLRKKSILIPTPLGEVEIGWITEVLRYDANAEKKLRALYPNPDDYDEYIKQLRLYNLFDSLPTHKADDNIVARLVFDERIVPRLSNLKASFTQVDLADVAGFTSTYTFRIYQLLMKFKSTGYVKISLDELRFMLMLKLKYPFVADLKRWVIETAINEINEKTPYTVKYELLKKGRKFTHLELKFKIRDKPKKALERDPNTIDAFTGQTDSEAKKAPSWQTKGLTDSQINKIKVNTQEFIDSNTSKISPNDRRGYPEIFESWRAMLKDPNTVNQFNKVQELLDRQRTA